MESCLLGKEFDPVSKMLAFGTGFLFPDKLVQERVFFCTKVPCWGSGGADGRHLLFLAVFLLILHFV